MVYKSYSDLFENLIYYGDYWYLYNLNGPCRITPKILKKEYSPGFSLLIYSNNIDTCNIIKGIYKI